MEPFPPAEPFDTRSIAVDGGHVLYVEQAGDPKGVPAVFLHGGPGSGCQPDHRRWFDPARFRVVLPDQRGAGRSTWTNRLEANTTAHLVGDLERIRAELGIARWFVVGGSWGATLALAYAEAHPERVTAMVLRAIFLGTPEEVQWAFVDGPRILRPELFASLVALLPESERADPVGALTNRLGSHDQRMRDSAACVWGDYERTLSELRPAAAAPLPASFDAIPRARSVPSTPAVEAHYFRSRCFLEPRQLLEGAGRLAGIPGVLVQGRYDLLCPPRAAHALAAAWPGCDLRLIEGAGHAASEPGIREAMMRAISEIGGKDEAAGPAGATAPRT